MCCFNHRWFYKSRPILLFLLALCETIFGCFRIVIYSSPGILSGEKFNFTQTENFTSPIPIAFIVDWASLLMDIVMVYMVVFFIACSPCLCCMGCLCSLCRNGSVKNAKGCCGCFDCFKALQRFVSLDCNCPCYRARPKLRFRLRFVVHILSLGLRIAAILLFWFTLNNVPGGRTIFYCSLLSLVFFFVRFLLELYHYVVWWCYTPQMDSSCQRRSKKHKRYLPYHLVGDTQRKDVLGDRPCTSDPCDNRHLSHVIVFHSENYKPQPRWSMLKTNDPKARYIGFHTTTPNAAVSIVHSEFQSSKKGMLGKGVYFARSMFDTIAKAQSEGGACIIAEIRMGKVFECNKDEIRPNGRREVYNEELSNFVRSSEWHKEYDTCYMNHEDESKDELCIKNPEEQIIKWIVVIHKEHDKKVAQYGLDTEFDSTKCGCV